MKRILWAAAFWLFATVGAFAQCSTQTPGGTICGNRTGALGLTQPVTNPVLGIPGTSAGQIGLAGSGGGVATVKAQATAGTPIILLPNTSGTLADGATAPLVLNALTGNLTCPTCLTGSGGTLTASAPLNITANNISIVGLAGGVLAGSGPAFTVTPVLGVPSASQGSLGFAGLSGGTATIIAQATAGSPTLTLPNTSGTFAVGASSPLVLSATTGALTCPTCATTSGGGSLSATAPLTLTGNVIALTTPLALNFGGTNASLTASNGGVVWSNASQFQILAGTATARFPLLSGATATPSWATIQYPASATSGGVAYFSSATAMASSGVLTANALVLGGGAGAAPTSVGSLGTTTTVLHGNAAGAPTFGAVAYADIATAAIATGAQYLAGTSSELVQSGVIYQAETTTTFSATPTFDFSTFINTRITLSANITSMTATNVPAGKAGQIVFKQSGAGSFTATGWPSVFKFPGGVAPTLTTGSTTAEDVLFYSCASATECYAQMGKDFR